MFKKTILLVAVLLIVATVFPLSAAAAADTAYPGVIITPMYVMIDSAVNYLSINSSGYCTMAASIDAISSVDSTAITNVLQKKINGSWTTYGTYYASDDDSDCDWTRNMYVSTGIYRLKSTFYAYDGGSSESTTKYSSQDTY